MLEKRKGIGISTILKLTLALMTASLFISAGTIGSLGQALSEGFNSLGDNTDYTVDIDQEGLAGRQKLSNLSLYVRQKAGNDGCAESNGKSWNTVKQQNDENGYPALSDSYLGKRPDCVAGSSGGIRGLQGMAQQLGKDQEGIYSRVGFEINKEITLSSSGGTWLENRLWGAARGSLEDNTVSSCNPNSLENALEAGAAGFAAGALTPVPFSAPAGFAIAAVGETITSPHFVGTGDHFVVFVEPESMGNRVNGWLNEYKQLNGKMYCYSFTDSLDGFDGTEHIIKQAYESKYSSDFEMTLCPGDVGYVQMNKGKPQNNGEAGESLTGAAYNYPHIVITRKGDDCTS